MPATRACGGWNKLQPRRLLAVLLLLAAPLPCLGRVLTGSVVGVSDGDTVTILDASRTQQRIRLAGIDAPERSQPYGNRSKQHLSALVYRQPVTVEWHKRDRYGRIVGKLLVSGRDAGLEQVRAGLAWWYRAYAGEQSVDDRILYEREERQARSRALGLWREAQPQPPWEFRRARSAP